MPVMAPNQPIEVRTPTLLVENALAFGRHRFALVVIDDRRRESRTDIIEVEVRRAGRIPPIGRPGPPIGRTDPRIGRTDPPR
jgi:hypothetical protein